MHRLGISNATEEFDPTSRIMELEKRDIKEVKEGKEIVSGYP